MTVYRSQSSGPVEWSRDDIARAQDVIAIATLSCVEVGTTLTVEAAEPNEMVGKVQEMLGIFAARATAEQNTRTELFRVVAARQMAGMAITDASPLVVPALWGDAQLKLPSIAKITGNKVRITTPHGGDGYHLIIDKTVAVDIRRLLSFRRSDVPPRGEGLEDRAL